MNKYQTYFGQIVTDDELNEIFDSFGTAIEQFVQDFNYVGIAVGGEVVQNASPNLSVLANGPAVIYDQFARRIAFGAPVSINCSVDENNQPTSVVGLSNEKWLSIFAKFVEIPSDPREDELGNTIFFRRSAGYQIKVVQGSEAPVGTAPRPALRGDQILLGDVKLIANQTTILNASISSTRTQVIFDLPGTPNAIRQKGLHAALQAMLTAINSITTDTLIVPAITGSPISLPEGSVHAVFQAFLAAVNALSETIPEIPEIPSLDGVAMLAASNVFTHGLNKFGGLESNDQLNMTGTSDFRPYLASGVSPTGRYKALMEFRAGSSVAGGQRVQVWGGKSSGSSYGMLLATCNAAWVDAEDALPQRWERRDSALPAVALIWRYDRLVVSTMPAGSDTWTDWPMNSPTGMSGTMRGLLVSGDVALSGTLTTNDLEIAGTGHSAGDFNVDGTLNADNNVMVGGNVHVGSFLQCDGNASINELTLRGTAHQLLYETDLSHTQYINLATGLSSDVSLATGTACWIYNGPGDFWENRVEGELTIPISLPAGAKLKKIFVTYYKRTGNALEFRFMHASTDITVAGSDGDHTLQELFNFTEACDGTSGVRLVIKSTGYSYDVGHAYNTWPHVTRVLIQWDEPEVSGMRS